MYCLSDSDLVKSIHTELNYLHLSDTVTFATCWEVGHVWQGTIDEWGYDIYKQTYHTIHCNLSMDVCLIDITECYLFNSKYLAQLYPECLQSSSIEQSWFFWFQWYIMLHWLIRNWQRYTFKSILMTLPAEFGSIGAHRVPMRCKSRPFSPIWAIVFRL